MQVAYGDTSTLRPPQPMNTDNSKAKVRWNVEPRLTIMRNAVRTVPNGANTTEVAGRFGIPARTLRRYVANAKRKDPSSKTSSVSIKTNVKSSMKIKRKGMRKKHNGVEQMIQMNLDANNDKPLSGAIPPLLRSDEMEGLAKKRTRTTSLELFLEALTPVAIRQKIRGNSNEAENGVVRPAHQNNNNNNNNNNNSNSNSIIISRNNNNRTGSLIGMTPRERLDSIGFGGSFGGSSTTRRARKNSLDLFNWALDEHLNKMASSEEHLDKTAQVASAALNVQKICMSDTKGLFTPRYRSNSIDFNATQDKDVFMSDSIFHQTNTPSPTNAQKKNKKKKKKERSAR